MNDFANVVSNTPLISIDLILLNHSDQILLGKRENKPAKNDWFVPGGRVLKNETLDDAFKRILKTELGLEALRENASFIDVYEHFYPDSCFGETLPDPSTHYVVLAYAIKTDSLQILDLPKSQHCEFRWWDREDALSSNEVHHHTKSYLK